MKQYVECKTVAARGELLRRIAAETRKTWNGGQSISPWINTDHLRIGYESEDTGITHGSDESYYNTHKPTTADRFILSLQIDDLKKAREQCVTVEGEQRTDNQIATLKAQRKALPKLREARYDKHAKRQDDVGFVRKYIQDFQGASIQDRTKALSIFNAIAEMAFGEDGKPYHGEDMVGDGTPFEELHYGKEGAAPIRHYCGIPHPSLRKSCMAGIWQCNDCKALDDGAIPKE